MELTQTPLTVTNANKNEMASIPTISRAEWYWAWLVSLLVVGLASLPVAWAWLATPVGGEFAGFLYNAHDGNTYLAKMNEGRRGEWVFHLSHTSEGGDSGAPTYEFYLILGKLAGLFGVSNLAMYHLARVVFGLVLLMVSYWFVGWLFKEVKQRQFVFGGLVCFAAGIGWLAAPLGWIPSPAPDLSLEEGFTFQALLAGPHISLAILLLIVSIRTGFVSLQTGSNQAWVGAGLAGSAMGFVHPFLVLNLGVILGIAWLWLMIGRRRVDWPGLVALMLVGLIALPGPALTWWGIQNDPLLQTWMSQNIVATASLLSILLAYGLLGPLATVGGWWVGGKLRTSEFAPEIRERWQLVTGWVGVSLVLVLLPVSFNMRFIEGIHLPLCCLAGVGWFEVIQPRLAKRRRKLARQSLAIVLSVSSMVLIFTMISYILTPVSNDNLYELLRPPYLSAGEVGAINWLRSNAQPGQVVLTGPILGNVIPGRVPVRVLWGHKMETLDPARKAAVLYEFYNATTDPATRQKLVTNWQLDYLVQGWRERRFGDFEASTTRWPLVYNSGGVQIYCLFRT